MNGARKMIFVLGTGRSGTCWVGDILGQHPEITSYIEPRPVFEWVTRVAVDSTSEHELVPRIFAEYLRLCEHAAPYHFADKCHPAIWIAEKLAQQFPNSYFLGVARDVGPTVASMMMHEGVRRWCEEWDKYDVPNRFLGITFGNFAWYRRASVVERCVARWLAHYQELIRLQHQLGRRYYLLKYERLVADPDETISTVQRFLGLERNFPRISPNVATTGKWRSQLGDLGMMQIQSALSTLGAEAGSAELGSVNHLFGS